MKKFLGVFIPVVFMILALGVGLYPYYSQWWNDRLQDKELATLTNMTQIGPEVKYAKIFEAAQEYNKKFTTTGDNSDYMHQLRMLESSGLMGRITIPVINVDLPIYHTSTDEVLRKGAGHMPETTLPVGGKATHAAITAHRGLAESVLFTNLDKVKKGDRFYIEVSGQTLAYEVNDVRIVKPDETKWLQIDPDKDLVTLVTCDPLGINTDRMLVTGERVEMDSVKAAEELKKQKISKPFPWWIFVAVGGIIFVGGISYWSVKPKKEKIKKEEIAKV